MSNPHYDPTMQTIARAGYPKETYYDAPTEPSAPSVSEEMGYAIGDLTDTLAKLTSRLAPVLQPPPSTVPSERQEAPLVAPMRHHLHRIHGLNESVRALLERLDV